MDYDTHFLLLYGLNTFYTQIKVQVHPPMAVTYSFGEEMQHQMCHLLANLCWAGGRRAGEFDRALNTMIRKDHGGYSLDWSQLKHRQSGPQAEDFATPLPHSKGGVNCNKHLRHLPVEGTEARQDRILAWSKLPIHKKGLCAACAIDMYMDFWHSYAKCTNERAQIPDMSQSVPLFPCINYRTNPPQVDFTTSLSASALRNKVKLYTDFLEHNSGIILPAREHLWKRGVMHHAARVQLGLKDVQDLGNHDKKANTWHYLAEKLQRNAKVRVAAQWPTTPKTLDEVYDSIQELRDEVLQLRSERQHLQEELASQRQVTPLHSHSTRLHSTPLTLHCTPPTLRSTHTALHSHSTLPHSTPLHSTPI